MVDLPENSTTMKKGSYARFGKRAMDLAGSAAGLIVLSPVMIVIAVLIKASSRGPVFFRQTRVGQFEKPFRIFKFRSMRGSASGPGALLTAAGDRRVTAVGRVLRRTKLDELPQLINVLLGQMSLVGPRPEVPEYTVKYSSEQRRIFQVKPGITSPVAARNLREEELLGAQADKENFYVSVLLPAKLKVELEYGTNISFLGDVKWILATLAAILGKAEASAPHFLHNPEFQRDEYCRSLENRHAEEECSTSGEAA